MTKQKIVIKVDMTGDKSRNKAMALVAATCGVESVALAGDAKDQVVVVGDSVDSVKLARALRRKVGAAHLVQVGEVKKEEEKKKQPEVKSAVVECAYPFHHYHNSCPPPFYHHYPAAVYHDRPGTCSIM